MKTRVRACSGEFINRDNARIKRRHRTIGERIDEEDPQDVTRVKAVVAAIIDAYNKRACPFLRGSPDWTLAQTDMHPLDVAALVRHNGCSTI